MQTLAFDGRTGAAGDMLLGALLAAGADASALDRVEQSLPVRFETERVMRNAVRATRVRVVHEAADDASHDRDGDRAHSHDHSHDHSHSHGDAGHDHSHGEEGHSHGDEHSHDHDDAEGHGHTRTYAEVVELVESMELPDAVEADALEAFRILGEAEASVHGMELEETGFHEVGTDDAIADVVGCMLLLDDLRSQGVERVVTTPLRAGGGEVTFSHGTYPVPSPAVVEIAERADWSLRGGPIETELLTPTGAAILAAVAEGVDSLPELRVDASGYGAGAKEFEQHPNVVRALVGETDGGLTREGISVLETNLDDATPEVLGSLQETLADAGARDVTVVPTTMKKSRPGHLVKVICRPNDAERVARRLAEETGTLGVREHGAGHRWVANREFETAEITVEGERYEVSVKVASDEDGEVFDRSAEYDDALSVARETGLAVREVVRRAEEAVRE
ncbi:nickel pincer cofactor biosynthesis protein LarC [Halolamina rubra]|uniref:nickel pincer cofactor biosynthesis protein LarC n=1 Tax=Halolamina rubra TaxID=1380430 RepID=UPI0006787B3E|nr:nickel pincer cofactor biosynthesis protein LarC [Halolamina rubra]